jgi:4-hydroxy-3-methylbut-2-en-1-yl diphosphate reductase
VAPERTIIVERPEDVSEISVKDPAAVSYLTQTTLAVNDTREIVDALRERFPAMRGPTKSDICYASQNRQEAIKEIAQQADLVFVVGSVNSSNSNRLVEVAREGGAKATLIEDESSIDPEMVREAEVIGITSGASTPEVLVQRVIGFLADLGVTEVEEVKVAEETIRFPLPAGVS